MIGTLPALHHGQHCEGRADLQALDHVLHLQGGGLCALRQRAHFVSHHREAATLLARARGLDRGVEREQVGLFRDVADDVEYLADVIALTRELHHGVAGAAYRGRRAVGAARDLVGTVHHFGDGGGDELRLLFLAVRLVVGGRRDDSGLFRGGGELGRGVGHFPYQPPDLADEGIEGTAEFGSLVVALHIDGYRQIAFT